jgi:hypothetical protein
VATFRFIAPASARNLVGTSPAAASAALRAISGRGAMFRSTTVEALSLALKIGLQNNSCVVFPVMRGVDECHRSPLRLLL